MSNKSSKLNNSNKKNNSVKFNFNSLKKNYNKISKNVSILSANMALIESQYKNNKIKYKHKKGYLWDSKNVKKDLSNNISRTITDSAKILIKFEEQYNLITELIKKTYIQKKKFEDERDIYKSSFFSTFKSNQRKKAEEKVLEAKNLLKDLIIIQSKLKSKIKISYKYINLKTKQKGLKLSTAAAGIVFSALVGAASILMPSLIVTLPALSTLGSTLAETISKIQLFPDLS
jgi:hypothetical protein